MRDVSVRKNVAFAPVKVRWLHSLGWLSTEGAALSDSAAGLVSVDSLMLCGNVLNAPSLRIGMGLLDEAEA